MIRISSDAGEIKLFSFYDRKYIKNLKSHKNVVTGFLDFHGRTFDVKSKQYVGNVNFVYQMNGIVYQTHRSSTRQTYPIIV